MVTSSTKPRSLPSKSIILFYSFSVPIHLLYLLVRCSDVIYLYNTLCLPKPYLIQRKYTIFRKQNGLFKKILHLHSLLCHLGSLLNYLILSGLVNLLVNH